MILSESRLRTIIREELSKQSQTLSDDLLFPNFDKDDALDDMMSDILSLLGSSEGMLDVSSRLNQSTQIVDPEHPSYDPKKHFSRQTFEKKDLVNKVVDASLNFVRDKSGPSAIEVYKQNFPYLMISRKYDHMPTFEQLFDEGVKYFRTKRSA
jgi:hypothetical protein